MDVRLKSKLNFVNGTLTYGSLSPTSVPWVHMIKNTDNFLYTTSCFWFDQTAFIWHSWNLLQSVCRRTCWCVNIHVITCCDCRLPSCLHPSQAKHCQLQYNSKSKNSWYALIVEITWILKYTCMQKCSEYKLTLGISIMIQSESTSDCARCSRTSPRSNKSLSIQLKKGKVEVSVNTTTILQDQSWS